MNANEFRAIRTALGLTQAELASALGFASRAYVARFEMSGRNARDIPPLLARLMSAYAAGYRPADWPRSGDTT